MDETIDCAVVGGGPAGLAAALYLLRFRRTVAIADKGSGRAALIPRSHNYPGFPDGITGEDLLARLHAQVRRYGDPIRRGAALGVEADGDLWRVRTEAGDIRARRVLFATGVVDRWPQLSGAREAIDRGVLRFCPICDGFEVGAKRAAIIGNDDHAAQEALFLRSYNPSVSLLTDAPVLSADVRERLAARDISIDTFMPGSLRFAANAIWAADPKGDDFLAFDVAYGALGVDPQTQLLARLGVALDAGRCVGVDAHQETSVPGVYAAGDVVRGLDQISVAVGEAAIAATAIHNGLREQDG